MTTLAMHSGYFTMRGIRALLRQPFYLVLTLIQPVIWLLLFGKLFGNVVHIPGFAAASYIDFLVPGVVAMATLYSSAWAGFGFIQDMERGVMDRFLTSPARRGALIIGTLAYQATTTVVQTALVLVLGFAAGARYDGGAVGVLVTVVCAVMLAASFAALSDSLALRLRSQEALIGFANMLVLPMTFVSTAMMARETAPGWIRAGARVNPVDWAVTASREALSASPQWSAVGWRLSALAALTVVMAWAATSSFRAYQRSV
jgi:ABC-2 type transport system permease protein